MTMESHGDDFVEDIERRNEMTKKGGPKRFRFRHVIVPASASSTASMHPKDAEWQFGCYFPRTDLCVTDMGNRGTGRPTNVEWLDNDSG